MTVDVRTRGLVAVIGALLIFQGCGSSSPDTDRVFDSREDAEQYALEYYCKADSARREFGIKETITCDDGTTLKIVKVWDAKGELDGFTIEEAS